MPTTAEEITRLTDARNKLRNKAVAIGIGSGIDTLDVLADSYDAIADNGAVDAEVKEGETYTIPKGYHNGSGTVSGVAGGGNYKLQTKIVTPTKAEQNVAPDSGYYGMSAVTVNPIPEQYQDVSGTTATEVDVLATKIFIGSDGSTKTGAMPNNGAVSKKLDAATKSYQIAAGYHSGSGSVSIETEAKTISPSRSSQVIEPTAGKVLESVTVDAIPADLQDVSGVTATADKVLDGVFYVDSSGKLTEGAMANNGSVIKKLDTSTTSQSIAKGYHDGTGSVSITLESKSATPTKSSQTIQPTSGKVLSAVSVEPIPSEYQDVTGVTATAEKVLTGSKYVNAQGAVVSGTMKNNGSGSKTMNGLTVTSVSIPEGYYDGSGSVSLTGDIADALAAI